MSATAFTTQSPDMCVQQNAKQAMHGKSTLQQAADHPYSAISTAAQPPANQAVHGQINTAAGSSPPIQCHCTADYKPRRGYPINHYAADFLTYHVCGIGPSAADYIPYHVWRISRPEVDSHQCVRFHTTHSGKLTMVSSDKIYCEWLYCKCGYFRCGKISWKCWQDILRGGNFHDTTPISFIEA